MIRRPLRNYMDDPRLQEKLRTNTQQNDNAAIPQMQGRQIYRNYAAQEMKNEQESQNFADEYNLRERDLDETTRRHGINMTNQRGDLAIERKGLEDSIAGANIGKVLGLSEIGVNYLGLKQDRKDREKQQLQTDLMINQYIDNATPGQLEQMWGMMPSSRQKIQGSEWYRRRYDPAYYK